MTGIPLPRFRVRWHEDLGFEMQCLRCESYWPLSVDFWAPKSYGLRLCAACGLSLRRRKAAAKGKAEKTRRWYMANRERITARRRERRAAWTEEQRAADRTMHRLWREKHRDELRIYNRQWRADHKRLAA